MNERSLFVWKIPCNFLNNLACRNIISSKKSIKVFNAIKHESKSLTQFGTKLNRYSFLFFFYVLKLFYTRDFLSGARDFLLRHFSRYAAIFLYYTLLIHLACFFCRFLIATLRAILMTIDIL